MKHMRAEEIRNKFLEFFKEREHAIVPSSSLIPDDPSVLLTTAGMQQFKSYYTGDADPVKDFGSLNTASIQKSFRTSDIDEVGDETHLTFFEMLGNFSFGGYFKFKEETIKLAYEFITKVMGLSISFVTVFEGEPEIGVPKDEESEAVWKSLDPNLEVREQGMGDVFWGPTGSSGPCGPTTEIYVKNAAGQDVEIWNCVFNQFYFPGSREELISGVSGKKLEPLKTPGVDTGMGLERLAMVAQNKKNIFETDLFAPLFELLPGGIAVKQKRIIVDHLRGSAFLLADGVRPSNKDRGYILRRLMRRALVYENIYKIPAHVFDTILHDIIHEYGEFYEELLKENENIREEFKSEKEKFAKTMKHGMKYFNIYARRKREGEPFTEKDDIAVLSGKDAFDLYQNYGFPIEITRELAEERGLKVNVSGFQEELKKHQGISRAGVEKKFGGHGLMLDTGELKAANADELKIVTRLHTATHLLNAALRKVLGEGIEQSGSDINVERTRFDFTFLRKLTGGEIQKIEELVNYAIQKDFPVTIETLPLEKAKASGALHMKRSKYPDPVKVYTVGNSEEVFSKELCGGPHVAHTGEIGRFKIQKEESSSAGIRRIRATVD